MSYTDLADLAQQQQQEQANPWAAQRRLAALEEPEQQGGQPQAPGAPQGAPKPGQPAQTNPSQALNVPNPAFGPSEYPQSIIADT